MNESVNYESQLRVVVCVILDFWKATSKSWWTCICSQLPECVKRVTSLFFGEFLSTASLALTLSRKMTLIHLPLYFFPPTVDLAAMWLNHRSHSLFLPLSSSFPGPLTRLNCPETVCQSAFFYQEVDKKRPWRRLLYAFDWTLDEADQSPPSNTSVMGIKLLCESGIEFRGRFLHVLFIWHCFFLASCFCDARLGTINSSS